MTLKDKTLSGLIWSFIDNSANIGISFVFGIILARLLSPREFGLVGMLSIFIAVSQSFVDSGFSQALIRKTDPTQEDYSTVFFFNIAIGIICFIILFIFAGFISKFFNEPKLKPMLQVFGLVTIIEAFTIIQRTILTKRIDFKLQTKISIISSFVSGIISIGMAYAGYGVWSLVVKIISMYFITSLLLWWWNEWRPTMVFSMKSFKELFFFGSKLLASSIIHKIYRNAYYLVIGKYFSAQELGYYTRADQFSQLPSSNITTVMQRVSYPILSSIKDDIPQLKSVYKKLVKSSVFITFILMLGMVAVAKPMVLVLIGVKWEPCVIYLQMLCFVGMLYPLHALNLAMLQVDGRSDLFLLIEIIKQTLTIPVIAIGIMFGIMAMVQGMIVHSLIALYLNSNWSGRIIGYSIGEQIKDVFPSFLLAMTVGSIVYVEGLLIPFLPLPLIIIQLITGAVLTFGLCEVFHLEDYLYIKEIFKERINAGKNY